MSIFKPGSHALRRGRFSEPGSRYFISFNTLPKSEDLNSPHLFDAFVSVMKSAEADDVFHMIAFTLMQDHVHLLFRLGSRLELGKALARLKFQLRRQASPTSISRQTDYYDHKLRKDEETHPILHYIYMNPYREDLVRPDEKWPFVYFENETWNWFQSKLRDDCPYPEWLQ